MEYNNVTKMIFAAFMGFVSCIPLYMVEAVMLFRPPWLCLRWAAIAAESMILEGCNK